MVRSRDESAPRLIASFGEHQDVEQLGAGGGAERVEAFTQPALALIGRHGRRLRCGTVLQRAVMAMYAHEE